MIKIFERKTTLPLTIVNTTNINLNDDIRSQLERKRTRFKQNIITFNHNEITYQINLSPQQKLRLNV